MAIRLKSLDLASPGMKRAQCVTSIGDVTAGGNTTKPLFITNIDCVIDSVDFYTRQGTLNSASNGSGINFNITVQQYAAGSSIAARGNSATVINSNVWSAGMAFRLTPSAANSLTIGNGIEVVFNLCGTCVLSAVVAVVNYTPLLHRQTR